MEVRSPTFMAGIQNASRLDHHQFCLSLRRCPVLHPIDARGAFEHIGSGQVGSELGHGMGPATNHSGPVSTRRRFWHHLIEQR